MADCYGCNPYLSTFMGLSLKHYLLDTFDSYLTRYVEKPRVILLGLSTIVTDIFMVLPSLSSRQFLNVGH